jgi:hypothetical protein
VNIATEGRDCCEVGSSAELSKRSGTRKDLSARPSKDIYVEQKGWFFDLDSTLHQKRNFMRKARVLSRLKPSRN